MRKTAITIDLIGKMIIGALFSLLLLFGPIGPARATAKAEVMTVSNNTTGVEYANLTDALNAAWNQDAQFTLTGDSSLTGVAIVWNSRISIDLNGYSLNLNGNNIWNEGELTIGNSKAKSAVHYFAITNVGWVMLDELTMTEEQKNAAIALEEADALMIDDCVKVSGSILYNGLGSLISNSQLTQGGAIINTSFGDRSGNLLVSDVSFVNCKADFGGVLQNEVGGVAKFVNVGVYGCKALYGGFAYNNGPAPGITNTLIVNDSMVKFCKAEYSGGGIFNLDIANVEDTKIYGCESVQLQGGGTYNGTADFPDAKMMIKDSEWKHCTSPQGGGAAVNNGEMAVETSAIRGCVTDGFGGAGILNTSQLSIYDSVLQYCYAQSGNGGGILNLGDVFLKELDLFGCTAAYGGGIFNADQLNVESCSIKTCSATQCGGAVYTDGVYLHAEDKEHASEVLASLRETEIENCTSVAPDDNMSIYVRNAGLIVYSGYVENPIYVDDSMEGYPACFVNIITGEFKDYVPGAKQIDAGSYLEKGAQTCKVLPRKTADTVSANTVSENAVMTYDGTAKTPELKITDKDDGSELFAGSEYTVSYNGIFPTDYEAHSAPVFVGAYKMILTLIGKYTGTLEIPFTIEKAEIPSNAPASVMDQISFSATKVKDIELPEGWSWATGDADTDLEVGKEVTATAVYTSEDRENYNKAEVAVRVTRSKCDHVAGKAIRENVKEATCEADGSYDEVVYCRVCHANISRNLRIIKATGHSWGAWKVTKEATETSAGEETRVCLRDPSHKETRPIPKKETKTDPDSDNRPQAVGEKVTADSGDGAVYIVTSSDTKKPTVSYGGNKTAKNGQVTIPGTVKSGGVEYTVTSVAENAFQNNKSVKKITIPNTVKEIGDGAFAGCSKLETLIIGKNVTRIGAGIFKGNKKLKLIKVKTKKLKSSGISKKAFKNLGKNVVIRVPKKKQKDYKKLFRKKGLSVKVKVKAL